jgi:hypothetical protein
MPPLGLEAGHDGQLVGRDPRRMAPDELRLLGHVPMSPLAAIRAHCLDCCGNQRSEVRRCTAIKCPSWPYRMGSNPYRAPLTAEVKAARSEAGKRLAAKTNPVKIPGIVAEFTSGGDSGRARESLSK